jgi:hypothetical protein
MVLMRAYRVVTNRVHQIAKTAPFENEGRNSRIGPGSWWRRFNDVKTCRPWRLRPPMRELTPTLLRNAGARATGVFSCAEANP